MSRKTIIKRYPDNGYSSTVELLTNRYMAVEKVSTVLSNIQLWRRAAITTRLSRSVLRAYRLWVGLPTHAIRPRLSVAGPGAVTDDLRSSRSRIAQHECSVATGAPRVSFSHRVMLLGGGLAPLLRPSKPGAFNLFKLTGH